MTERIGSDDLNEPRRTLLKQALMLTAAAAIGTEQATAQQAPSDTTRFFPGFTAHKVETSGATINLVKAGNGPPLLLMHGAPQSHISWRLVAPALAKEYTVIATDLRGYGDSSKPPEGENHAGYSKRTMAVDQVEVMK